jgi:hypothetical protein
MVGDLFKIPGSEALEKMWQSAPQSPMHQAKPVDKPVAHGAGGGGGRAKSKPGKASEVIDPEEKARGERANTPEPEKPVDRTVVKITDIKWQGEFLTIGSKASATMDVSIPPEHASLTRITFTLEQQVKGGAWKTVPAQFEPSNATEGKARCELLVPDPLNDEGAPKPEKILYRIVAKHSYSEPAPGPGIEAKPGSSNPFDAAEFYSPARGQYLLFETQDEYQSILDEIGKLEKLKGKSRQALEATDPSVRKKLAGEVEEETKSLFEGKVIENGQPLLEELITVRKPLKWASPPGWVYIRPEPAKNGAPLKGKWYRDNEEPIKKNLQDLLKKAPGSKEHSPFFSTELKAHLFKKDPLKGGWPIDWKIQAEKEGQVAGQPFTFSKSAAVCRYSLGWDGIEATANWKEKKIHIGTSGQLKYALFEGKAEGEFPWPEEGVNLLELIKDSMYLDPVIAKGRKCLLRLHVHLKAEAYAGLTINGALNLIDLDLSREKLVAPEGKSGPTAGSKVEAKGFAGAKATVGLTVGVEWTAPGRGKFKELGSCGGEAGVSAGVGAEIAWKVEYKNGLFHFHGGASLTAAIGCKGTLSFELGVQEGWHFIGYLLHSFDFHFMKEIDTEAFNAYAKYAFTLMTLPNGALVAQDPYVQEVITDFGGWLRRQGEKDIKQFKKNFAENSIARATLAKVPPEALGQALITVMKTHEPDDYRQILMLLNSAVAADVDVKSDPSANHKLKWTLRFASGSISADDSPQAKAAKKDAALQAGILAIREFGKSDMDFQMKFAGLLAKYEVK